VFEKERIRRELSQKRLLLCKDELSKRSSRIESNLLKLPELSKAKTLLFYYPIKGEPNLLNLAQKLIAEGRVVAFPKVEGKELLPLRVNSLKELYPGKFSIPEPPLEPSRLLKELDLVLVPGIAFDRYGFRVGYGGGYYDRFLEKFEVKTKIGVCFSFQLLPELPREPFDQPVDLVVTEKETVRRREWKRY